MRTNRLWAILLATAFSLPIAIEPLEAQGINWSISNEFRYGIGKQFDQDRTDTKEYFENLLGSRVYLGDFTLGFRFQVDKPREYGRDTVGLKEYYAEYRRDGLRARAGTFYNLVGRGMVMNTFESRSIGFDTQTEGVRIDYESEKFKAGAWGGLLGYADILTPTRVEDYLIRAFSGEVRPIQELGVGGSFMAATGQRSQSGFARAFDAYLRELYLQANSSGFRAFLNLADKRTVIDSASRTRTTSRLQGYGFYGLLGYTSDLFGVTVELKDYRYDLVEPPEQQSGSRATRSLPFQNAPTLIPEHDKTLLARNPHTVDPSDELGFQIEALLYPADGLTLTLLTLGGSRHNSWERIVDTANGGAFSFRRVNELPIGFAQLSDFTYSPYWEVYAHGEYEYSDEITFAAALQRKDNSDFSLSERFTATTGMVESLIDLTGNSNLHAILEVQRVFDSKKVVIGNDSLGIEPYDGRFFNALLTLEYAQSPEWSVNARMEVTTTDRDLQSEYDFLGITFSEPVKAWPVIGGTYRIGNAHTIALQYGAERGGVVCTGGVCRYINPFTGLRLSVVSKL